jgi:hypothetical protein
MIKYEDHKKLIVKLAWQFSNGDEEAKRELIAEGNYVYCLCLAKYDPRKKAKFSTYLWNCLYNRFVNIASRSMEQTDIEPASENMVERNMIFRDAINHLSKNSKEIVKLVIDAPDDFCWAVGSEYKMNQRIITDYLVKRGWSFYSIWKSFAEIQKMLATI